MTRDKAIEIIGLNIANADKTMPPDVLAALKLAVEALKEIRFLHKIGVLHDDKLLPGEDP